MLTTRLDAWLVQNGHYESREKARYAIDMGVVQVNGRTVSKRAQTILESDIVTIVGESLRYVSKGGLKLEKAIEHFNLDFKDLLVLDVGASTGGFTDCALQHGARKVYAVDVATDQLHPSLQNKSEVVSIEGLHIRDLEAAHLEHQLMDVVVVDVSFISLAQVLPHIGKFLSPKGYVLGLIKPQFETGKRRNNNLKKVIVRADQMRPEVLERIWEYTAESHFALQNYTPAEADSQAKHIEFMALFQRS